MQLTATCILNLAASAESPMAAMLRPRTGPAQWVVRDDFRIEPWVPMAEYVDVYGNLCQRLVVPQGHTRLSVAVTVEVEDHIAIAPRAPCTPMAQLPDNALLFLLQSRYCPSDKMLERALWIVGDAWPGYDQAERIRQWIHDNLAYRYGVSSASTDAIDSMAFGAGVCRDFAHVGIALCRSLRIPARIVVGYLHGLDPMDLHAWFEAFVDGRWYSFDATQSAPRGGRIVLAYGRDAADVAFISDYGPSKLALVDMFVRVDAA